MSGLWGEFEEEEEVGSKEAVPGEIVKFFVMQAMQQDPYRIPPPAEKKPDGLKEIEVMLCDTLGLEMDDRVVHTIKLLQHSKEMNQLIEAAREQIDLLSESQISSLPPAAEVPDHLIPPLRHKINYPLQHMDELSSDFTRGIGEPIPEISGSTAKLLLTKSVAALLAHTGFDTTTESVLSTMTDAADVFMKKLVGLLRVAVDRGANIGATGFPDAIERVLTDMNVGSMRELHDYYQRRVIVRHEELLEECRNLNLLYCGLALQSKADALHLDSIVKLEEPDDVPEIHFPASGDDGVDELQPSLEPGYQMLHSLEQEVHLQQLDSQEEVQTNDNDSPLQDAFENQLQSGRKRKRN